MTDKKSGPSEPRKPLRQRLPSTWRAHHAFKFVERAEAQHRAGTRCAERGAARMAHHHWTLAIQYELRALAWWPVEHAGMVPEPGDELLDDDGNEPEVKLDMRCVLCGEPIARPLEQHDDGEGLYCTRCQES